MRYEHETSAGRRARIFVAFATRRSLMPVIPTIPTMTAFGTAVRYHRMRQGLSLWALAARAATAPDTARCLEKGTQTPQGATRRKIAATRRKIAAALGVDVTELP